MAKSVPLRLSFALVVGLVFAAILFCSCAGTTPVSDLSAARRDRPIEVVTRDGIHHYFDEWRIGEGNSIIGFTRLNDRPADKRVSVRIIPADSIVSVSSIDTSAETIAKSAFIVLGASGCALFVWSVARAMSIFAP